jgi:hypothetical protein
MSNLWSAVDELAWAWAESPHTRVFRDGLSPVREDPNAPLRVVSVQHLMVHYEMLQSQPLLLGMRVPHLPEFGELHREEAAVRRWFDSAQRFAFTFVDVIEFLRSRLPRYPALLVPDLVPEAPRVYEDGFWDRQYPWPAEVRRAGLQLQARPTLVARALDLTDGGTKTYAAIDRVLDLLRASGTWQRFVAASDHLDEAVGEEAKRSRREYRKAVADDVLDRVAGPTGMRRQTMRRTELLKAKRTAEGNLREYYDTFDEVDELISAVAGLLSHRITVGDIREVGLLSGDWGEKRDLREVRVRASDTAWPRSLDLVKFEAAAPSLGGVMVLHNLTFHFDDDELAADGPLLTGSVDLPSKGPPVT